MDITLFTEKIERDRETIISNARQDAMIERHNTKKLCNEIVERANRYFQHKLKEANKITESQDLDRNESLVYEFSNQ